MEMHIHSVFISFACGARSSAPTCQSAPYGAAGIFATPPGAIFSQGAQGPDMPGFRHPRNPARSPRRPAQIGESPRRDRRPGPRSNREAIRPLPRRAAPAPPTRRRRAIRACAPVSLHRPSSCPAPAAPGRDACGSHAPRRAMPRPRQAPTNRSQTSRASRRPRGAAGAGRTAAQRRRVAAAPIARRRKTCAPGEAPPRMRRGRRLARACRGRRAAAAAPVMRQRR